ncbi:MAG: glycosyltransferase [Vicinamibacterales bacterium]
MHLSVIVTIVDGGATLERCLSALATQEGSPSFDAIVPWDDSVAGIPALARQFPRYQFLGMGRVGTERPSSSAAGQHELYDRRRAAGLRAAGGALVAILEDRGVPRPDWARTMIALHERLPHAVIGGAIENGRRSVRHWAAYICDFSRYQRPFEAGPRSYVSDVNVGYKRRAVDATASLWSERYHETTVHWALQASGETLYLSPELVVDQCRGPLKIGSLIGERFASGRLFAYTRARESRLSTRLALGVLTAGLPFLLFGRHLCLQLGKGVSLDKFVQASPAIAVLLLAWSVGEAFGYFTGKP